MRESALQEQYRKQQKRRKYRTHFLRLSLFAAFLAAWELSARTGLIDSFIFSSPSQIAATCVNLTLEEGLFTHIGITLYETIVSFLLVLAVGIGSAVLLWLFPGAAKVCEPYLVILNSLPKSALAPLLIVWLGANTTTIIVSGMSVAVFGSIMNLYTGFTEIDRDKLTLIYTLGGKKRHALFKVVLPGSIPLILSVLKVNIGLCLVGVIIGEFIGARKGLGYIIIYASQVFKLPWLIASIIILCVIAVLLYSLLNLLEKCYAKKH